MFDACVTNKDPKVAVELFGRHLQCNLPVSKQNVMKAKGKLTKSSAPP